jgi:prolyl 4-hydroxylase
VPHQLSTTTPSSADQFAPSLVSTGPAQFIDPSIRRSAVATLPRSHAVKCIEARAQSLQGWGRQGPRSQGWALFGGTAYSGEAQGHGQDLADEGLMLERLKIQKYGPGGHYTHHYDWQGAGKVDRVSSFMVYVDANCTGGGTGFPRLAKPASRNWCSWIECAGDKEQEGITFKPVRGNAVFWENLRADGTGYAETWHAGLPVETGTKIGLNIWSWYRF